MPCYSPTAKKSKQLRKNGGKSIPFPELSRDSSKYQEGRKDNLLSFKEVGGRELRRREGGFFVYSDILHGDYEWRRNLAIVSERLQAASGALASPSQARQAALYR
ncbi:hypothetical protein ACLOJK_029823 [Asimina triloba]